MPTPVSTVMMETGDWVVVSAAAVEIAVVAGEEVSGTAVGNGEVAVVFTGVPVGEGIAVPEVLSATGVPVVTGTVVTDIVMVTVPAGERDVSFAVTTGVVSSAIDTALAETGVITNNTRSRRTGSASFKESL